MSNLQPEEPQCIPQWLHWLDNCPSTNTWALSQSNLGHGEVVFTPQQTNGRGQHGRTWYAPTGVLTASFVLEKIPTIYLPILSLASGLAVVYAVEDLVPKLRGKLQLKWPNDIFLNQRKLAGILCEAVTNGVSDRARIVVGIGLNRCADFTQTGIDPSAIAQAISLHECVDEIPDELALLEKLRQYLLETSSLLCRDATCRVSCRVSTTTDNPLSGLLTSIRQRDFLYDKRITLNLAGEKIIGKAAGIDDSGCLLVRVADGSLRAFASGSVSW